LCGGELGVARAGPVCWLPLLVEPTWLFRCHGEMSLLTSKPTTSRNASATLAFHQWRKGQEEAGEAAGERANIIRIGIEQVKAQFRAKLTLEIAKCFTILGPSRETKPEAICDGLEIGRIYVGEGSASARKCAMRLVERKWSEADKEGADARDLENFSIPASQLGGQGGAKSRYLIPPGEGWTKHDEDTSIHERSGVYFMQVGERAGEYLKRNPETKRLEEVGVPHRPREYPIKLGPGSASFVRKGAKLDRAVLLGDIAKIARLALKFPLSFVDTPACAYALFQGHRSSEAAQFCAENFHKKLLPILAEKIHTYETWELQDVLHRTLQALDSELLKAPHAFSGCSALLALVLGERIIVAGVGRVRAVLLPENAKAKEKRLLTCSGCFDPTPSMGDEASGIEERDRAIEAGAVLRDGLVFTPTGNQAELDDAKRILAAASPFQVLQLDLSEGFEHKQVRSAYRKLALRVHPDKQAEGADLGAFKAAFARLDAASDKCQALLEQDAPATRELDRVLRSEVHTRAGATALFGTEDVDDANKKIKDIGRKLDGLRQVANAEVERAMAVFKEAVATLERGFSKEALPRQEAVLREGLSTSRAMGARDLRFPYPIVQMKPETAATTIPTDGRYRLALLCGATAALADDALRKSTVKLARQPKASALRWCSDSDASWNSSFAICIGMDATGGRSEDQPPAKRAKSTGAGPEGTVRVRHILFRHQQLRQPDLMARREGNHKTAQEAEMAALGALEKLVQDANQFLKLCRELSDCQSASQPGMLSGDLGWIAKGQADPIVEDVAFSIGPNQFGDVVTSARGVHIIQRLA